MRRRAWLLVGVLAALLTVAGVVCHLANSRQPIRVGVTLTEADEAMGRSAWFGCFDCGSGTLIYREGFDWSLHRQSVVGYAKDDDGRFRVVAVTTSVRRPTWLDAALQSFGW